jgi:hypothetical protein
MENKNCFNWGGQLQVISRAILTVDNGEGFHDNLL